MATRPDSPAGHPLPPPLGTLIPAPPGQIGPHAVAYEVGVDGGGVTLRAARVRVGRQVVAPFVGLLGFVAAGVGVIHALHGAGRGEPINWTALHAVAAVLGVATASGVAIVPFVSRGGLAGRGPVLRARGCTGLIDLPLLHRSSPRAGATLLALRASVRRGPGLMGVAFDQLVLLEAGGGRRLIYTNPTPRRGGFVPLAERLGAALGLPVRVIEVDGEGAPVFGALIGGRLGRGPST